MVEVISLVVITTILFLIFLLSIIIWLVSSQEALYKQNKEYAEKIEELETKLETCHLKRLP